MSYDYDRDLDLKNLLVGQARHKGTPSLLRTGQSNTLRAAGSPMLARASAERVR